MQFNIPEDDMLSSSRHKTPERPLRAEGSMNYREFIALVKNLWEEVYPDIPILPVQGSSYTRYPVIVYSLENRKTHTTEPKQRHREEVVADGDENVIISGQRFQNYIAFSAITDAEPDLCDTIVETFEDFMLEYTPVFKRLGLSDIFYGRRLSDREETRTGDDACIRTVVYMCIIERTTRITVSKIKEILTNVSVRSLGLRPLGQNSGWIPTTGSIEDGPEGYDLLTDFVAENKIVYLGKDKLSVGDSIKVYRPYKDSLEERFSSNEWQPAASEFDSGKAVIPGGLAFGSIYRIAAINNNVFSLVKGDTKEGEMEEADLIDITSPGWFKIVPQIKFIIDIDDSIDPSTPNS